MTESQRTGPEGLWNALTQMEVGATIKLMPQLDPFEQPLRQCYEAGVQAPMVPAQRQQAEDMRLAALFLKKALNDLRAVWILCQTGYTSQAAAVAASLFENALAATCIAGDAARAATFRTDPSGDLPWTPIQLSKLWADQWSAECRAAGKPLSPLEYEQSWREVYSAYKWLCKIKHPTLPSAMHDAGATQLDKSEYVVMAAPDIREADLAVKALILIISIRRCHIAIRRFALAAEQDTTAPAVQDFIVRMNSITPATIEAHNKVATQPLPFDLRHTTFAQEWVKLVHQHKK